MLAANTLPPADSTVFVATDAPREGPRSQGEARSQVNCKFAVLQWMDEYMTAAQPWVQELFSLDRLPLLIASFGSMMLRRSTMTAYFLAWQARLYLPDVNSHLNVVSEIAVCYNSSAFQLLATYLHTPATARQVRSDRPNITTAKYAEMLDYFARTSERAAARTRQFFGAARPANRPARAAGRNVQQ